MNQPDRPNAAEPISDASEDIIEVAPVEPAEIIAPLDAQTDPDLDDDDADGTGPIVKTQFQKTIAAIPEEKWNLYQIISGIIAGGIITAALFMGKGSSSMTFIVAVCIALFLPRYFEEQGDRPVPKARICMCIAIAIGLLAMVLIYGIQTGFTFNDVVTTP